MSSDQAQTGSRCARVREQNRQRGRLFCELLVAMTFTVVGASLGGCSHVSNSASADAVESTDSPSPTTLHYVGSSTVANFIAEAEPNYGTARFVIDTLPESLGGERAISNGSVDFAGVAHEPLVETLQTGVLANQIGVDHLTVIVHQQNPVTELSISQLAAIFSGRVTSWRELGGHDEQIIPFIVGNHSATHHVFRDIVLGADAGYQGCSEVKPDGDLPKRVEEEPGGIGVISVSFVCGAGAVRVLHVDGESPTPPNPAYPLSRPLYLLWRRGHPEIAEFVAWAGSTEGEAVLEKCFGAR